MSLLGYSQFGELAEDEVQGQTRETLGLFRGSELEFWADKQSAYPATVPGPCRDDSGHFTIVLTDKIGATAEFGSS